MSQEYSRESSQGEASFELPKHLLCELEIVLVKPYACPKMVLSYQLTMFEIPNYNSFQDILTTSLQYPNLQRAGIILGWAQSIMFHQNGHFFWLGTYIRSYKFFKSHVNYAL